MLFHRSSYPYSSQSSSEVMEYTGWVMAGARSSLMEGKHWSLTQSIHLINLLMWLHFAFQKAFWFSEIMWNNLCKARVKLKRKCVFSIERGDAYNAAAKRQSLPEGPSFKRFRKGWLLAVPDSTYRNVSHCLSPKSPGNAVSSGFGWVCWKCLALLDSTCTP